MTSVKSWLRAASLKLANSSDSPLLDAELLVSYILKKDRTYLYTHGERELGDSELDLLKPLLKEREAGKPIAYIVGQKSFWSLDLKVNDATLIPRPETELLVEQALHFLKTHPSPLVLDLGTGSGAIALAIAKERPDAKIYATDISKRALSIAKENAQIHGLNHIHFIHANWFDVLPSIKPILIVSNPPYIDANDPLLEKAVKAHEPHQALISKQEGLADIKTIIRKSPNWLSPGGMLLIEFGLDQEKQILGLLDKPPYTQINFYTDLQGITRAVSAVVP